MTKARDLASNSTGSKPTLVDAKGDLLVGTAADTAGRLAVGTNGYTLVADSSVSPQGLKWAVDPVADVITTAGDLIYGSAADTVARLGIGTAGQVLTVNSGATAPQWATASAGGMTVLASGSLSGSTVTLNNISQDYKNLQLVVREFLPASDNFALRFRINNDSGANAYQAVAAFDGTATSFGTSSFQAEDNDNVLNNGSIIVDFYDYAFASNWKIQEIRSISQRDATTFNYVNKVVFYAASAAITRIDMLTISTTMAGGTYVLYGIK